MPHDLRSLTPEDLPELGRFLTEGFHAPADAPFASPDVLRWKYLDSLSADPLSLLARDAESGRIVGHLGVCRGRFVGLGLPAEGVSTLHMIDWLASAAGKGVGAMLMRRAHQSADTQFALGASTAARAVMDRAGYSLAVTVPVYRKVFRPSYRLRASGSGPVGRLLRASKDAMGMLARPSRTPRVEVELRPVAAFGAEVEPITAVYGSRAIFTERSPERLNHLLAYPGGGVTGWHVVRDGSVRGFALLSVIPRDAGAVYEGRVADCLLDDLDSDAWHAAVSALTSELKRQGADFAIAFAGTSWTALALHASGYTPAHGLEFRLRDRSRVVPDGSTFHLTPLEADYAYT